MPISVKGPFFRSKIVNSVIMSFTNCGSSGSVVIIKLYISQVRSLSATFPLDSLAKEDFFRLIDDRKGGRQQALIFHIQINFLNLSLSGIVSFLSGLILGILSYDAGDYLN